MAIVGPRVIVVAVIIRIELQGDFCFSDLFLAFFDIFILLLPFLLLFH